MVVVTAGLLAFLPISRGEPFKKMPNCGLLTVLPAMFSRYAMSRCVPGGVTLLIRKEAYTSAPTLLLEMELNCMMLRRAVPLGCQRTPLSDEVAKPGGPGGGALVCTVISDPELPPASPTRSEE